MDRFDNVYISGYTQGNLGGPNAGPAWAGTTRELATRSCQNLIARVLLFGPSKLEWNTSTRAVP